MIRASAPGQCGCGAPDTDSDSDDVADCNDNCPDDPEKVEPDICGCGAPDSDDDSDDVTDCLDNCPLAFNPDQNDNDRDNDRDNDNGKDRDNGSDANRDGKPRRVLDYVNQLFEHIVKRPLFVADGRRPDTRSRDTKLRAAASREAVLRSAVKSVIKDLALLFRYRHVSHNSIDNQAEKVTNELFRLIRLLFS